MAVYFFRNNTTDWATAANWSLTDGGGATGAVPLATDTASFTVNSGNCNIAAGTIAVCVALTTTGYVSILSSTNTTGSLSVSGSITFAAGMSITATCPLVLKGTGNIAFGGKTWGGSCTFQGTSLVFTLTADMIITGLVTINGTTALTLAGTFNMNCNGGLTVSGVAPTNTTVTFILGGGTWTSTTVYTVGNVTLAGNITFAATTLNWRGGTLTYSSGTITTTGSTLTCTTAANFNCTAVTFNNVSLGGTSITYTLSSDLNVGGLMNFNGVTGTTLSGAYNINCSAGCTIGISVFAPTNTPTIVMKGGTFHNGGTGAGPGQFIRCHITFDGNSTLNYIYTLNPTTSPSSCNVTWVSGTVTCIGLASFAGSGAGSCSTTLAASTSNITWNNMTCWGNSGAAVVFGGHQYIAGNLTLGFSALLSIFTGGYNLYVSGNFTQGTGSSSGSPTVVMVGTGYIDGTSGGILRLNLTINTTGDITFTAGSLNYNIGTITLTAANSVTTTGHTLLINAGTTPPTLNTSGMTWNNLNTQMTAGSITLSSNLNFSGTWTVSNTTTISGAFNINCSGSLSVGGFIFTGGAGTQFHFTSTCTGTWSGNGNCRINVYIDSGSDVTLSGTLGVNAAAGIGSLTINGTIHNTTGSLNIINSAYTITNNVAGTTFNTITYTPNGAQLLTFLGTYGITLATLTCIPSTYAAGVGLRFVATNTYTITETLTLTGTAALPITFISSTGGSQAILTLQNNGTATHDVGFVTATDIDSSAGQTIWNYKGTLSNASNWKPLSYSTTSVQSAATFG